MNRIAKRLPAVLEMVAFIAGLIADVARWCWQSAAERAREILFPGYRRKKREKQIAEKQTQELAARKKGERTESRILTVIDFARHLPQTPIASIRSMRDYDDPDVAPYYKGKSKFFNEHYLWAALNDERLAEHLREPLRSEHARCQKRENHLLLISGTQNDFREYSIYRTNDGEFACVEWWHHDWYNWQGALVHRGEEYRDDFDWHRFEQTDDRSAAQQGAALDGDSAALHPRQ